MTLTYRILSISFDLPPEPRGCKNYCGDHYPNHLKGLVYRYTLSNNVKKCTKCEITILDTKDVFCKCCGVKLRYKPHHIANLQVRYQRKGKRY